VTPTPRRKKKAPRITRSARASRRRRQKPRKRPDAIEVLMTAGAAALGLSLDPAWHDGVAFNLRLILRHAALVDEFAVLDEAEPAPVFHA
jgi:hypothetical protein